MLQLCEGVEETFLRTWFFYRKIEGGLLGDFRQLLSVAGRWPLPLPIAERSRIARLSSRQYGIEFGGFHFLTFTPL
jgi:hypothetical protein